MFMGRFADLSFLDQNGAYSLLFFLFINFFFNVKNFSTKTISDMIYLITLAGLKETAFLASTHGLQKPRPMHSNFLGLDFTIPAMARK